MAKVIVRVQDNKDLPKY